MAEITKGYVVPREQELLRQIVDKLVVLNLLLQVMKLSDKMNDALEIIVLKDHLEAALIEFAKEFVHLDNEDE